MTRNLAVPLTIAGAVLAATGFFAGRATTHVEHPTAAPMVAGAASSTNGHALYWHDPMVPATRFDKPGKSPFMDMQLVPVYADEASDSGIKVGAAVQQNLGIRTVPVRRETAPASFDAVGSVQFDDRLSVTVQTRVAGYVEHLAVRVPMERVRQGQALATIFAPDWLAPQNELLALERAGVSRDLVDAARERLHAMSVPPELIRRSEETGIAQARFTLSAPQSGVVAELGVREGASVSPGMTLFRLAGLEKVWAVANVPEAQAVHLVRGQKVKAVLQADTSQTFDGTLDEILPQVDASTRTLQARFEVDNRDGRLTPGQLLRLQVAAPAVSRLVVPSEAVIRTGTRTVVIVRKAGGAFEPRNVQLGADEGDVVEITRGLAEGDAVVASGQFLIDSEANLRSATGNLATASSPAAASASSPASGIQIHEGHGKIENVDGQAITISHGPIATLNWPSMTMGFGKPTPQSFAAVRVGDSVRFRFKKTDAGFELVSVDPEGASK
jgi:Cu(I)/Ag(I) efflux system membrane fusion protein